jgi:hypothetical protein
LSRDGVGTTVVVGGLVDRSGDVTMGELRAGWITEVDRSGDVMMGELRAGSITEVNGLAWFEA